MSTVTEKLDTSFITKPSDTDDYVLGPQRPSYPGWTKNKIYIMKNLLIFFVCKFLT